MNETAFSRSLEVGLPFVPFQTQYNIAMSDDRVTFIGGGYGSGKTVAASFLVFLTALANPWRPEYGEGNPTIVVSAPTARIMRDTTLPALLRVIPNECIRRHRKSDNELLLSNGCLIKLRSGQSKFEGLTICAIWMDECSLYTEQFFHNAVARVRDEHAPKERIIVSGIPFEGTWVEDQFREPREGQGVHMLSAYMNPYLPLRSIHELKSRISASDADTLIYGRWMKRKDLIFPEFSMKNHIKPIYKDAQKDIFLGVDPGMNHSVAIVCQMFDMKLHDGAHTRGMNIIDEVIMKKASLEVLMREVKSRGYNPCKAYIDPTTRLDEFAAIRRVFPRMPVITQQHKGPKNREAYGIDCVRAALEDANGNVRLYMNESIKNNHAGLVSCLQSYRWNPRTDKPIWADDSGDHSIDALRYSVVGLMPIVGDFRPYTIRR